MIAIISLTTVEMVVFDASITTMFLLSWLIVVPAAMKLGYTNSEIEELGFEMGKGAFKSNIIVLSVGVLIATWIAAGTIPTIVYSGLTIITPKYFLVTTLIVCSLTSIATGTSWGTLETSGIALMSIGTSMGVPGGLTAGAIISGAFFGDKISPLSDSTNLAAAVCKTDVITHIKHMIMSTIPSYVICVVLYTVIGFKYANNTIDYNQINQVMEVLKANFNIGFVAIIPIIFLFILLLLQKPSIVSILASASLGAVVEFVQEGESLSSLFKYMLNGFSIETGLSYTDQLLNRGGIMSMAETVLLVFVVFVIASILQKTGFLEVLLEPMLSKIGDSRAKLVTTTFVASYLANAFSSSMMCTSVFVGIRMFTLSVSMIISGSISKSALLLTINYGLIVISGVNLLINEFGLMHWVISIILVLLSLLITRMIGRIE